MNESFESMEKFLQEKTDELAHVMKGLEDEMEHSRMVFGQTYDNDGNLHVGPTNWNNDMVQDQHYDLDPRLGRFAIVLGKPIEPVDFYEG